MISIIDYGMSGRDAGSSVTASVPNLPSSRPDSPHAPPKITAAWMKITACLPEITAAMMKIPGAVTEIRVGPPTVPSKMTSRPFGSSRLRQGLLERRFDGCLLIACLRRGERLVPKGHAPVEDLPMPRIRPCASRSKMTRPSSPQQHCSVWRAESRSTRRMYATRVAGSYVMWIVLVLRMFLGEGPACWSSPTLVLACLSPITCDMSQMSQFARAVPTADHTLNVWIPRTIRDVG